MGFGRGTRSSFFFFSDAVHPASFNKKFFQAHYFKNMLRDADHLDKVGRLRISEDDIKKLAPGYEVWIISHLRVFLLITRSKMALKQLKDVYTHSS